MYKYRSAPIHYHFDSQSQVLKSTTRLTTPTLSHSKLASTYDSKPWQAKMSAQISAFLQQNVGMLGLSDEKKDGDGQGGKGKTLLDYACGTGMVTKALQPYIHSAVGIDISPSMVSRYNEMFAPTSSSSSGQFNAKAKVADYLQPHTEDTENKEDDADFHLAVVGLGFHHFHDPAQALEVLKNRLEKGGVLAIVDFLPFPAGGHSHGHGHEHKHGEQSHSKDGAFPNEALPTIKTSGFSKEDMASLFGTAGLGDVGFAVMDGEVEMFVGPDERRVVRRVFVARGVRT